MQKTATVVEVHLRLELRNSAEAPVAAVAIAIERSAQHLARLLPIARLQRVHQELMRDPLLRQALKGRRLDDGLLQAALELHATVSARHRGAVPWDWQRFVDHTLPELLDMRLLMSFAGDAAGGPPRPAAEAGLLSMLQSALLFGLTAHGQRPAAGLRYLAGLSEDADRRVMALPWKVGAIALMQVVAIAMRAGLLPTPRAEMRGAARAIHLEPGLSEVSPRHLGRYQGRDEEKVRYVDPWTRKVGHPWIAARLLATDGTAAFAAPVFATLLQRGDKRDADALADQLVNAAVALEGYAQSAGLRSGPFVVPGGSWMWAPDARAHPVRDPEVGRVVAERFEQARVRSFLVEIPATTAVPKTPTWFTRAGCDVGMADAGDGLFDVTYLPHHSEHLPRRFLAGGMRGAERRQVEQVMAPVIEQRWGTSAVTARTLACVRKPFDRGTELIVNQDGNLDNARHIRMAFKMVATVGDVIRCVRAQRDAPRVDGAASG